MRLVYISPLPWNSFSQRPHELVQYFHASTRGEVLWIDPYPTRLPHVTDLFKKRPTTGTGSVKPDWLEVMQPKALPIEPLPYAALINRTFWSDVSRRVKQFSDKSTFLGIGKPCALAMEVLASHAFRASFYDAMDDFPAFYTGLSRSSMVRKEAGIVGKVSRVLTSSSIIQGRLRELTQDIQLVLNACASDRLPSPREKGISGKPLVIGYIGTIAHWFDWELIILLAKANPHAKFRLIGPLFASTPLSLPDNISLEPPLPHAAALEQMKSFDMGIIPFKQTELTASVDPIKYYEYRALGLPVISSRFGEMSLRDESDGVWLIQRDSDMQAVVQKAMACQFSHEDTQSFRDKNSWRSRFDEAKIFADF